ncbi:MAG: hypothetical protein US72_C0002G0049 [Microgenomates group bacterium GW2011_GWC1_38_12]|uniref:Type IV secretion system coupling protein TraD DNA-binding domain-containing protein n=1 Tax=Candidatus Vogelbacteria bacterium RIFOXYB1_FULL_42_16 TaxID=1802436 RepID=A0A1G2QFG2_9BACT|nr:MAG: hypothetical protein US72_C0002G0049 [Microgenomates group bacterium GW2011_GWC1_38_12]KKS78155.1 MAG: hypothetical protein UV50_C0001G0065 [Parcubacteria group bacterium GW2011_GWB1_42_9]OHA59118.1 MAG: hypothetical protein A2370_02955 [Candidatus Vogelbacteria bacterium RIFOXYB1_FULL_42_16]
MSSPQTINYFGQTDFRGRKTRFGIKADDRARHMYIIGKTGMGKSTMLENMAIQDIKNGEGMAFIDPHGKTAELLLDYVPQERIKDVIYFAPFDLNYPISFNVMEDVGKDQRHLVANGLMATFKKIWPDVWSARMEYILNNTILALLEYPNSTLLGVNRMLSDKSYRDEVVNNISDPSVKSFWVDEFAKYNERYMQEAGDAIKNKIGQFTSNPLIRNIIGQPKSTIDMRAVMDDKKILIINLSKGRVGEQNASLLGGMIITKIYLSAMSRANASEEELRRLPYFYFFVDEFQSFVNDSFADILSEARKYKLSLTIAHQYVEQMPETVRSAVFGNVGTTICFRVGPFDATLLEEMFSPTFMKEDLVNLGFAQIYLTMSIDGVGSPPFSAVTLPPIATAEESYKPRIVEFSRAAYAMPREKVEIAINDWHELKFVTKKNTTSPSSQSKDFSARKTAEPSIKKTENQENKRSEPIETKKESVPVSTRPLKPASLNQLRNDHHKTVGGHREALRNALQDVLASVVQKEKPAEKSAPTIDEKVAKDKRGIEIEKKDPVAIDEVKPADTKSYGEAKPAFTESSGEAKPVSAKGSQPPQSFGGQAGEARPASAKGYGEAREAPAELLKKILAGEE